MGNEVEYLFSKEQRRAYEMLPISLGAYQYIANKVVTLLVSDALCGLMGMDREKLVDHLNNDMFGRVHPEDAEMLARLGYRFATRRDFYDITYRSRLYGGEEYRVVHAIGQFRMMEDGTYVAFLTYADITDSELTMLKTVQEFESPKVRFFDEHMGALVIVSRKEKQLLYFNKAVCRMLSPGKNYDSGMTFQEFFYSDKAGGIKGLFDIVDMGPKKIREPHTNRDLEVNVVSSTWNNELAYVIYFYETQAGIQITDSDDLLRHKRMVFNNLMFSEGKNKLPYSESGYEGLHVWNLTLDELVYREGQDFLSQNVAPTLTFDDYFSLLRMYCVEPKSKEFLELCTREYWLAKGGSDTISQKETITLQTDAGRLYISLEITLMVSPDSQELFVKVWEENITDGYIVDTMITKTVEQGYDYVAYIDVRSNKCRIIYGKENCRNRKNFVIDIEEYIKTPYGIQRIEFYFGRTVESVEELIQYVYSRCDETGTFSHVCESSDSEIKRIVFQILDRENRIYYLRCTDVTELLQTERNREKELKEANDKVLKANRDLQEAVRAEHEKVESVLLQTILSVNNALDARDEYTCRHSERVSQYSAEIARRIGWEEERVQNLYNIALVHDIGKIGIPDALLLKKNVLTDQEYEQIKEHVEIGSVILKDFTAIDKVSEGALYHHERYDGSGYTRGLKGEEIPIEARIIGIADAVDAMNSTRPYREKQNLDYIRAELERGSGTQFDPLLVTIMLGMIEDDMLNIG